MSRKKNGFIFEVTAWEEKDLKVYLANREAKALLFIHQVTYSNEGSVHPYELAHFLWPEKYPELSSLTSDQSYIVKNGVSKAMGVVSNILNAFKYFVEKESLLGIYDPFPFYIMNDPRSEFYAITISDGIKVIKYYPINKPTKE
jgi:hypothetical protein